MSSWPDNLPHSSLDEVLQQQVENRAWSKDLRRKANLLVNSRLANTISQEDYLAGRKVAHEETTECRRRAHLLETEITRYAVGQYTDAAPRIACPADTCHTEDTSI